MAPLKTKIYSFKPDHKYKKNNPDSTFVNTNDYFFSEKQFSTGTPAIPEKPADKPTVQETNYSHIINFLDSSKADIDKIGYSYKPLSVVNMNKSTAIPSYMDKKKNKNDFYRFLLA